jgi:phospholipid transport system substrate-binding protein
MTFIPRIGMIMLLCGLSVQALAASDEEIVEHMRGAVDAVLERVSAQRAELEANPQLIHESVADIVTAYFDFNAMTRSAMGRYWPRAQDGQKAEVEAEFSELLIRTYGSAIFKYSGKPIAYKPVRWSSDRKRVLVPTVVETVAGAPVPIEYKLHEVDGVWRVYDVEIENISLVSNYRSTFTNEIRNSGVDGLIVKLKDRNKELGG